MNAKDMLRSTYRRICRGEDYELDGDYNDFCQENSLVFEKLLILPQTRWESAKFEENFWKGKILWNNCFSWFL